jgi:SAM-dependent methyltransferase
MASNKHLIIERYSNKSEDGRATQSRADGLEFYFTKKVLEKYVNKQTTIIEIGCGTGYYGMFLTDKCRDYIGVDLSPENIEVFNEKIIINNIKNIKTMVGDVTNLENIGSDGYDIVMVLGPMYHLPPEDRELALLEAKRICKNNGIIIFAYINKLGAYLQSGILSFPEHYPNKTANVCVLKDRMDDTYPGIFFYTTPLEIEQIAEKYGLNKIKNIGVIFF